MLGKLQKAKIDELKRDVRIAYCLSVVGANEFSHSSSLGWGYPISIIVQNDYGDVIVKVEIARCTNEKTRNRKVVGIRQYIAQLELGI